MTIFTTQLAKYYNKITKRNKISYIISIYLEVEKLKGVVKLRKYISETGYELVSMNKTKEKTLLDSDVALTVVLDMKSTTEHQNVLDAFNNLDYVNYLEEI